MSLKFKSIAICMLLSQLACQKTRDPIPTSESSSAVADPSIKIAGFPQKFSRDQKLDIVLAGEGIIKFRYKLTDTLANPCTEEFGYGPVSDMVPVLAIDLQDLEDGEVSFCIVGQTQDGSWQSFANPTSATWIKRPLDLML